MLIKKRLIFFILVLVLLLLYLSFQIGRKIHIYYKQVYNPRTYPPPGGSFGSCLHCRGKSIKFSYGDNNPDTSLPPEFIKLFPRYERHICIGSLDDTCPI